MIPKFSCRVLNSSFSFEFVVEIFDSNFEFKFLEFSCRISNSSFSFRCSIRLLEIDRQIRLLEFRFSIRMSNSSSLNFRLEFVVEIFVVLLYSTSRISIRICRRNFRCSIRLLEVRLLEVRLLESSPLNFEFVLIYSTSRISIRIRRRNFRFEFVVEIVVFVSHSSFEFLIELFNFRRNFDSRAQLLC